MSYIDTAVHKIQIEIAVQNRDAAKKRLQEAERALEDEVRSILTQNASITRAELRHLEIACEDREEALRHADKQLQRRLVEKGAE